VSFGTVVWGLGVWYNLVQAMCIVLITKIDQSTDQTNLHGVSPHPPPFMTQSTQRDVPILIDEHYNARALEDMIIIAENAANQVGVGVGVGGRGRRLSVALNCAPCLARALGRR